MSDAKKKVTEPTVSTVPPKHGHSEPAHESDAEVFDLVAWLRRDCWRRAARRELCERCITKHLDTSTYEATRRIEQAERDTLDRLVRAGLERTSDVDMLAWLKSDIARARGR